MPRRECDQLLAPKGEKRLGGNEDRAGPLLDESFEGDVKVALAAGLYDENLFTDGAGGRLQLSYFGVGPWSIRVCQQADRRGCRHPVEQQLQSFSGKLDSQKGHAGDIAVRPVETGDDAKLHGVAG